ncbi:hypothetical protein EUX98_g344 [Antrodiella citrinella]|uniref:Chromatin assembly factor 1 subunit A dimerization domain-containing protein n=1 Tax=Antrodiella citrinella TaxID=2447956 RepID=A0A4V3XJQ0_9APHY|nr:hypothetical protein EUX98_g344 [Antrodiella citrinella]
MLLRKTRRKVRASNPSPTVKVLTRDSALSEFRQTLSSRTQKWETESEAEDTSVREDVGDDARFAASEIVQFREMLERRIEEKLPPLEDISDEFKPLIAKLSHESDKNIVALAKHLHGQLIPAIDEEDEEAMSASAAALPLPTLDRAAKAVAERVDYGLDTTAAQGARIPAGWHIWRWEVKQEFRSWLPKAAKEKVEVRLAERIQAKNDVQTLFESLPEQERKSILNIKDKSLQTPKAVTVDALVNPSSPSRSKNAVKNSSASEKITIDLTTSSENTVQNGPGRPKKPTDPEKAAKEKEKEDKKLAKIEREKKEEAAQAKSRSLMANFFGKTKAKEPATSRSSSLTKEVIPNIAGPSNSQSDYAKTFRPFMIKRDVDLAPINWSQQHRKARKFREDRIAGTAVIVIDDDEERDSRENAMQDVQPTADLGQLTAQERLSLKSYHPHVIRNILNQLNEAEIAGDVQRVRSLLSLLRDRRAIPAKVLIFTEDARPGYFGTWTRNSREVGPRTPFARDVVALDYTYDSGEEWEEESGEADDVVEDAEEDDAGEEPDSDLDSWLVEDDEVEEPGTPIEDRELSPGMPPVLPSLPAPKRKPHDEPTKKSTKRRKVVVPLVPFTKGPCWENEIGSCSYDAFKQYRVELLNDTPFPIDPFKYVARPVQIPLQDRKIIAGTVTGQPPDTQFAIPALPGRLVKHTPDASTSQNASPSAKRSPVVVAPKTPFPDAHLPILVAKIQSMQTGNIAGIVETVYQDLRIHKVKKNAIEAKLKEIGEKSKETKLWVVKPEFLPMKLS